MIDPVVAAVAGALVTVAGLFYRFLLQQLAEEKAESKYWRDYALREVGLADIATEQAEQAAPPKRRRR